MTRQLAYGRAAARAATREAPSLTNYYMSATADSSVPSHQRQENRVDDFFEDPLVFGESIAKLVDGETGVGVGFASGTRQRYHIVVGADGMHSATRRLTFGPETQFLRHLGFYVALTGTWLLAQALRDHPTDHRSGVRTISARAATAGRARPSDRCPRWRS